MRTSSVRYRLGCIAGSVALALVTVGAPLPVLAEGEAEPQAVESGNVEAEQADPADAAPEEAEAQEEEPQPAEEEDAEIEANVQATGVSTSQPLTLGQFKNFRITGSDLSAPDTYTVGGTHVRYFYFNTGSKTEEYQVGAARTGGDSKYQVYLLDSGFQPLDTVDKWQSQGYVNPFSKFTGTWSNTWKLQPNSTYYVEVRTTNEDDDWTGTDFTIKVDKKGSSSSKTDSVASFAQPLTLGQSKNFRIMGSDLSAPDTYTVGGTHVRYFYFNTGSKTEEYQVGAARTGGDSKYQVYLLDSGFQPLDTVDKWQSQGYVNPFSKFTGTWSNTWKLQPNSTYYVEVRTTNEGDDWTGTDFTIKVDKKGSSSSKTDSGSKSSSSSKTDSGSKPSSSSKPSSNSSKTVSLYRCYNPASGEHLYTTHKEEVDHLVGVGWNWERDQTRSLPSSGTPVWRVYNPATQDHHYTSDAYEYKVLTTQQGWVADFSGAPAFYSAGEGGRPFYRMRTDPYVTFGHLYSADANEKSTLFSRGGWVDEGIGWYCLK